MKDERIFEEDIPGELGDETVAKLDKLQEEFGRPEAEVRVTDITTGEILNDDVKESEVGLRCAHAVMTKQNVLIQFKCLSGPNCPVEGEWHDVFLVYDGRVFLNEKEAHEQLKRAMRSRIIAIGMEGISNVGPDRDDDPSSPF